MTAQAPPPAVPVERVEHQGGELRALQSARNYRDWLFSAAQPHLGRRVLEIGAGIGTMTECLMGRDRVVALELTPEYAAELRTALGGDPRVEVVVGDATDRELLRRIGEGGIDSAMSFNVLEHIEDDVSVLSSLAEILPPGGRFVCFVPAFPSAYGVMDRNLGHCRRYTRAEIASKARAAGFAVADVYYMNLPGYFAWLVSGRVLRSSGAASMGRPLAIYDRYVVPVARRLERHWRPPVGQSVLLVAERR